MTDTPPDHDDGAPLPALELAGYPLGKPIASINDAIRQDAVLSAVEDVVKSRRKGLKAYVHGILATPGARAELDGIGTALVTDPTTKATVVDDDAFRAWALTTHPDRTGTVERLNAHVLEDVLAGEHGDALAEELRNVLDGIPGATETRVLVDEKLAQEVAKPTVARELEDGRLVDKASGEIIPGVELRTASTPSPRLTPDKALVARLADEITERLAPLPNTEES